MDLISVAGLLLGITAIIGGQVLEGGHIGSLIQPTAFLIVIGGTMGAVLLQSSLNTFFKGVRMLAWIFMPPKLDAPGMVEQLSRWSHLARKEGLLSLENQMDTLEEGFFRKGLQLLVDGAEPERLRDVMDVEIGFFESEMKQGARVWESAGGYAPTIGILGAVMGLIHVMENLSDPSKLGSGIAVAFVATIYGVGSANLLFLPIAKKLMANISRLVAFRELYVDGLIGIANGDNPRIIESRLQGYVI
jgi:chemotaxis protein MotA